MSSRLSNPQAQERRANANANANANGTSDRDGQPRPPRARAERSDSRSGTSPQSAYAPYTNPAHKRSASGNPRPMNRSSTEERRTERTTITTKDKLIARTRSTERRPKETAPPEKWKMKEPVKMRPPETKSREPKQEPPPSRFEICLSCFKKCWVCLISES